MLWPPWVLKRQVVLSNHTHFYITVFLYRYSMCIVKKKIIFYINNLELILSSFSRISNHEFPSTCSKVLWLLLTKRGAGVDLWFNSANLIFQLLLSGNSLSHDRYGWRWDRTTADALQLRFCVKKRSVFRLKAVFLTPKRQFKKRLPPIFHETTSALNPALRW
jgi:hypothetical protein